MASVSGRSAFLEHFELIVDATYTRILKPDPRAYALVTGDWCLRRNVFVDDQLHHIRGAQAVGLQTVHFDVTRPAASYAQALALLGL
ncbi:MAG: hypothetical protein R3E89_01815 [Thiolinea sp.]